MTLRNTNKNNHNINYNKGNISIKKELLNKYSNFKEIFDNESNNFDGVINVNKKIPELKNVSLSNINVEKIKKLANIIFENHHPTNKFINNKNVIVVTKSGINESVEKIYYNKRQRALLKEHLKVFSDLGDIIEHATLVNQVIENKQRKKYNSWHYYFDSLKIGKKFYYLEFEIVSMDNGENHYRIQRLKLKTKNRWPGWGR